MDKGTSSGLSLSQIISQISSSPETATINPYSVKAARAQSSETKTQLTAWPSSPPQESSLMEASGAASPATRPGKASTGGAPLAILVGPDRFGSTPGTVYQRKTAARAALVGFQGKPQTMLAECFRQFGIETQSVSAESADRLRSEKFEACVVSLAGGAEVVMEVARSSRSNSRCVIYAVGGTARDAMKYSKYGVNAIFPEPLERQAMLKLVRATKMLVLHEFRRYVRIPIITEVSIVGEGKRVNGTSIEMSSGGMSLKCAEDFFAGENVELSFALMTLPRLNLKGTVSWSRPKTLGVKFDPSDNRRHRLKSWIDSYLEN